MADLYAYARKILYSKDHTDWKAETASAYTRWMDEGTEDAHDDIVLAIAPGILHVAKRYALRGIGWSREDAFYAGVAYLAKSLSCFDVERSPRGVAGISSYLLTGAEMAMNRARKDYLRTYDHEVRSLDYFEDTDTLDVLSYEDEPGDTRRPVSDVVHDAIETLSPEDRLIATWRLVDGLTWPEVVKAGAEHGCQCTSRQGMHARFQRIIRPRLQKALRAAGYDEDDVH